jgi:MoaA/NifB/PqqE/SkfB family radical SAM enzyme
LQLAEIHGIGQEAGDDREVLRDCIRVVVLSLMIADDREDMFGDLFDIKPIIPTILRQVVRGNYLDYLRRIVRAWGVRRADQVHRQQKIQDNDNMFKCMNGLSDGYIGDVLKFVLYPRAQNLLDQSGIAGQLRGLVTQQHMVFGYDHLPEVNVGGDEIWEVEQPKKAAIRQGQDREQLEIAARRIARILEDRLPRLPRWIQLLQVVRAAQRDDGKPYWGSIEVTHKCNRRCTWCYKPRGEMKNVDAQHELSATGFAQLAADLSRRGTVFFDLTGGNPLEREDIYEVVRGIAKYGVVGINLRDLTLLELALDGGSQELEEVLQQLWDAGVAILKVSVDRGNLGSKDKQDWAMKLGVSEGEVEEVLWEKQKAIAQEACTIWRGLALVRSVVRKGSGDDIVDLARQVSVWPGRIFFTIERMQGPRQQIPAALELEQVRTELIAIKQETGVVFPTVAELEYLLGPDKPCGAASSSGRHFRPDGREVLCNAQKGDVVGDPRQLPPEALEELVGIICSKKCQDKDDESGCTWSCARGHERHSRGHAADIVTLNRMARQMLPLRLGYLLEPWLSMKIRHMHA